MAEKEEKQADYYGAVLADLRAKRSELDAAIAAIERLSGAAPSSGAPIDLAQPRAGDQGLLRSDAFFNMSILDATQKYLNFMKKPQSLMSVAKALEEHGMIHTSKAWPATVFTTLRRAEERGDRVLRVQKNWALAEWYPNRPKKANGAKPTKKRGKASRAKGKVQKIIEVPSAPAGPPSGQLAP